MDIIETLTASIAEKMMIRNGNKKPDDENTYDIEWDLSREDSQYSIITDDVRYVVNETLMQIMDLEDEALDPILTNEGPFQKPTVHTTNALFIFMDSGVGNPTYVRDVREWLRRVDEAGLPDELEIEGTLHLSYDIRGDEPGGEFVTAQTIECGDCGGTDLLVNSHDCPREK